MNKKAQAGLEYLMTYGWALILVVTVIGVLIFIVSTPVSDVSFRSSDPTKLMLKGATALADAVQIKLQNITGGKITITALTSDDYGGLTINGETLSELNPVEIGAGGELVLEGNGNVGTITIGYRDFAGIQRTVTITGGSGGTTDPAVFDPGSGTALDPYNIRDCDALQAINDGDLDAYYQLTQSFSCSGIANFIPIAIKIGPMPEPSFNGHFDGQGFTISGLTINQPSVNGVGLFGNTGPGSSISNVGLTGVTITGKNYVGGLVGVNNASVTNSYSTGSVNGSLYVGGLVGYNLDSIFNSYSTGSVEGSNNVGGLVGVTDGVISASYSTGSVDGSISVGGLVGYGNGGSITNSYATGNVDGGSNNGGLIGSNSAAVVNSYSTGSASGTLYSGGLIGVNNGSVTNSYSTGSVTGFFKEGLVASNNGTISNCYWFNSLSDCHDDGNDGCPTAAPEASASSFYDTDHDVYDTTAPNWDFGTVWQSTATYPTLQ